MFLVRWTFRRPKIKGGFLTRFKSKTPQISTHFLRLEVNYKFRVLSFLWFYLEWPESGLEVAAQLAGIWVLNPDFVTSPCSGPFFLRFFYISAYMFLHILIFWTSIYNFAEESFSKIQPEGLQIGRRSWPEFGFINPDSGNLILNFVFFIIFFYFVDLIGIIWYFMIYLGLVLLFCIGLIL